MQRIRGSTKIKFTFRRCQVQKDGSFTIVDMSNRGGRTFHGLGTQLTGYKVICLSVIFLHTYMYLLHT